MHCVNMILRYSNYRGWLADKIIKATMGISVLGVVIRQRTSNCQCGQHELKYFSIWYYKMGRPSSCATKDTTDFRQPQLLHQQEGQRPSKAGSLLYRVWHLSLCRKGVRIFGFFETKSSQKNWTRFEGHGILTNIGSWQKTLWIVACSRACSAQNVQEHSFRKPRHHLYSYAWDTSRGKCFVRTRGPCYVV